MTLLFLSITFAVTVSALCSLFEAVLYAVPVSHIESMAQAGKRSGLILRELRRDVDRPIAAILSLNTIANTAGAAVAGAAAVNVFGETWIGLFTAFFTFTILLCSEVVPKTIGVVHSRSLAPIIALPLLGLVRLMSPLIWLIRFATRLVRKKPEDASVTTDELIMMARIGMQAGTLSADEASAIENVLSLKSRRVRDIMTPRTVVFARNADETVESLRAAVASWPHGKVPVFDTDLDDVIGLVYRREVLRAVAEGQLEKRLLDLMNPIDFVEETQHLDVLLKHFLETRLHLFVVVGEFGGTVGVVTLEDVLEELLGREIVDKFDRAVDMRALARERRDAVVRKTVGQD